MPGFLPGFCRGFRRRKLEKCPILTALSGRNPGTDRTLIAGNCPILTGVYERPRTGRRSNPPPHMYRLSPVAVTRVGHDPDVLVPTAARAILEHELARREQRLPGPAIRAV